MYASNAVAAGLAHGRIAAVALTARPGESPGALAALAGSVPPFGILAAAHSVGQAALILPIAMLLVAGFAMLAPVLIPPLAWLLTAPLAAAAAATGMLATLRLSGAAPGQVLRMIGVEALLVSGIGTLFAAGVTAVTVIGLRHGLAPLAPAVRVVVPWQPLGGIALACLVIALLASLIPASLALRRPPLELTGGYE